MKSLSMEIAPFQDPNGDMVLLLYDRGGRLATRISVKPFQIQFPTVGPGPKGTFCSDFSPLYARAPKLWLRGVYVAPWPSIVYSQGNVLVAVDKNGRWVGECEVPPGSKHKQRAYLALWELLTTGDAVKAERIACGRIEQQGTVYDPAVIVLLVPPKTVHDQHQL